MFAPFTDLTESSLYEEKELNTGIQSTKQFASNKTFSSLPEKVKKALLVELRGKEMKTFPPKTDRKFKEPRYSMLLPDLKYGIWFYANDVFAIAYTTINGNYIHSHVGIHLHDPNPLISNFPFFYTCKIDLAPYIWSVEDRQPLKSVLVASVNARNAVSELYKRVVSGNLSHSQLADYVDRELRAKYKRA